MDVFDEALEAIFTNSDFGQVMHHHPGGGESYSEILSGKITQISRAGNVLDGGYLSYYSQIEIPLSSLATLQERDLLVDPKSGQRWRITQAPEQGDRVWVAVVERA